MLSLYILICNLNWCFPSLWWFLYQIHNFSNNLCDKEMFMSHLMWCANYIKNIFHDKNNITHCEREKKNRKALAKPVPCLGLLLQKRNLNLFFHLDCPFFDNFWLKLICFNFCIIIYSFVCKFPLHCYWYRYNEESPCGVLQKRCSYKFRKIHMKAIALKPRFRWSCRSAASNSIKKRLRCRCFLVNFVEFIITPFL